MMEYAANLQKFTDALEKQKQQQLEDLRRRLLEKRRQNKKDLHKTQVGTLNWIRSAIIVDASFPIDVYLKWLSYH